MNRINRIVFQEARYFRTEEGHVCRQSLRSELPIFVTTTISFIDRITMLAENGAKSIAVPLDQFGNIGKVSQEILSKIVPIPISTPEDAFMRGRLEE